MQTEAESPRNSKNRAQARVGAFYPVHGRQEISNAKAQKRKERKAQDLLGLLRDLCIFAPLRWKLLFSRRILAPRAGPGGYVLTFSSIK